MLETRNFPGRTASTMNPFSTFAISISLDLRRIRRAKRVIVTACALVLLLAGPITGGDGTAGIAAAGIATMLATVSWADRRKPLRPMAGR